MSKNNYNYSYNRPYPIFAEGGGAGGGMRRQGYMDQTKKETKPEHTMQSALFDVGKFALNTMATPLETISGRNFYDPEFSYSGMDKADAISSGIGSAVTDIVGTYFGGPFYTMGKKAIQSGVNKVDPEGEWENTNAQVTEHGGEVSYKIGKRDYKTRGSVSNRTAGNVRKYNTGTGVDGQGWQNFANILGGTTGNQSTDGFMSLLTGGSSTDMANRGNSGGEFMSNLTGSLGGNENLQGIMGTYGKASASVDPNTIGKDAGNTRSWEGLDGGLINTWTTDTPQQIAAKKGMAENREFATDLSNRKINYHSQEGNTTSGEGITGDHNYMTDALTSN